MNKKLKSHTVVACDSFGNPIAVQRWEVTPAGLVNVPLSAEERIRHINDFKGSSNDK